MTYLIKEKFKVNKKIILIIELIIYLNMKIIQKVIFIKRIFYNNLLLIYIKFMMVIILAYLFLKIINK